MVTALSPARRACQHHFRWKNTYVLKRFDLIHFFFTKNNGAFLCAGAVLESLVLKRAKARCAQARWFVRVATLSFGFWRDRGDLAWKNTYVSNHLLHRIVQFCQMTLFLHDFSDRKMSPDLPFRMNLCPGWAGSGTLACKSCAPAR